MTFSTTNKENLRLSIQAILDYKEVEQDKELSMEEHKFVTDTLVDFVHDAITKYIAGAKEHGGKFLHDRDHLLEAGHETLDLFWYLSAARNKQKQTTK